MMYFDIRLRSRRPYGSPARTVRMSVILASLLTICATVAIADTIPPTVIFQSPAMDAVVGGIERFKVEVSDQDGLAATNPVKWGLDGGPISSVATSNSNYDCGENCAIYEFDVDTTVLANGAHTVSVEVADAVGNVGVLTRTVVVANSGSQAAGNGMLLRRTHGSQSCIDCHNLETHSSHSTGTKYGNWAVDCLICHTPHQTRNIYLVRESLQTPNSGTGTVDFREDDSVGGTNPQWSYLGDYSGAGNSPYDDGICEVCHTQTSHYRNDNSGGDHSHNAGTRCIGCHPHSSGFSAGDGESAGGANCSGCHPQIWQGMNGDVAKTSRHAIGNVAGVNDTFADSGVSWVNPLSSVAVGDRSCVNMCHPDHVHNAVGGATHDFNVHEDASTGSARQVTRGGGGAIVSGTPARTDFNGGAANDGSCVSCHKNPIAGTRPSINGGAYDASAHDFVSTTVGASTFDWTYTLHDGSTFDRNCTKCHAEDSSPDDSTIPFSAVHFSDNPLLLSGTVNPAGSPASFQCYACHGNGTVGADLSGKDIASQIAKSNNHPADDDNVHDSVGEEAGAAFGNQLGGAARHANCLDCHNTHEVKGGTHATPGNKAGPPLEGAWGAQLSSSPGFWAAPTAGNFTKKTIVAGTDAEATLCFKCHSSYYGTLPTSPSGGYQETDTAREFNPNNTGNWAPAWSSGETAGSFHPVLASAGNNLGATSNIKSPWTRTSLMTCSDCHESNSTADPNGPHGSTAGFILKGPNTLWNANLASSTAGMPNGTFCINCHNQNFTNSRFPGEKGHTFKNHNTSKGLAISCFNCHSPIPHGTARPGLLVTPRSESVGGLQLTDASPYLRLPAGNLGFQINSYPADNTTDWSKDDCSCGNKDWGH
jgi:hypothetical protein